MKQWIAAAALLLVTGCGAGGGNQTNNAEPPRAGQTSELTQASSISNAGSGTVSIHQAPGDGFGWFEWILRDRAPANDASRQGNGAGGQGTGTGAGTGT